MARRQHRPFAQQVVVRLSLVFLLCAFVLLLLPAPASAITVTPTRNQLNAPADQTYQYVYGITNDGPAPRSLTLKLDRYSQYLASRVTFSKEQFTLAPGQTENVQLSFVPTGLGPETHTLTVGIYDGLDQVSSFELLTTIPGTPIEQYTIAVKADDTTTRDLVPVEVTLADLGNVLGYARITLDIIDSGGGIIGSVQYPDLVQVAPNDHTTFNLAFTQELNPGFYTARVSAVFPSKNISAEKPFAVALGETKESLDAGSDLVLSFASLGNPTKVTYGLVDGKGVSVAAGSFTPQQGDLVIPTSELPAGAYTLTLTMGGKTRTIAVIIKDKVASLRFVLAGIVCLIVLVGAWSVRRVAYFQLRLMRLRWAVARRERMVNNLINRAHRLVDEYAAHAARSHTRDRGPGATDQGPR